MSTSDGISPEESYIKVSNRWMVQASVGLGVVITTLDTGGINVALHTLAREFGVDAAAIAWMPLLGFLIVTSTLLLFGRLSDLLGSKQVFVAGFAVYAAGSLSCALSTIFPVLLVSRGLQAVGVSMLSANSNAILTACFPPRQRGMSLGINSTLVGLGYFVGPIVAGLLITALGWRYFFFAAVPLCLVGLAVNWLVLPQGKRSRAIRFDFAGATLFALSAVCLLMATNVAARASRFEDPAVWGLLAVSGISAGAFLAVERRAPEPIIDLSLFRNKLFSLSLASAFLIFFGIAGQEFLVPLFLQQILAQTPASAGLAVSVVPFIRMLLASPSGLLSDRFGPRWLSTVGALLVGGGLLGLGLVGGAATPTTITLCLGLIGAGSGLYFSPNLHATMAAVPPERLGMGSGAIGLRRNLGQSMGVALAAFILQAGGSTRPPSATSYQTAFYVGAFFTGLAALASLAAGSTKPYRRVRSEPR